MAADEQQLEMILFCEIELTLVSRDENCMPRNWTSLHAQYPSFFIVVIC